MGCPPIAIIPSISIQNDFKGDRKYGSSIFTSLEKPLQKYLASKVPKGIETYHLTLMTVVWCAFIILFSYWAKDDIRWLWAVSAAIVLQYVSDLLDGEVGRQRNTGLLKWGFYMDHFLDFIFLSSILVGYFFVVPTKFVYLHFFMLVVFGAYMVHSFLAFSALNRFQIAYLGIGPTEIRLGFIIANTLLITVGTTYMGELMPLILSASFIGLCITVYHTQKRIWAVDMEKKAAEGPH